MKMTPSREDNACSALLASENDTNANPLGFLDEESRGRCSYHRVASSKKSTTETREKDKCKLKKTMAIMCNVSLLRM